ncbi:redoxin family protein [Pseudodesulfovibrio sp. F-1]|uniref:Redoxin family protein n=1 Tax=Pseudodesulfovibrio alkaliphilus TaxID=2661613 RepID=A0A7K1KMP6_9BACT|nr:TlpA disulfide reductase family protein [Pseudodesulfovibrio alkaliphilus]MUM77142.1 redoxin family protein [Pseudodesulfovibrio alkaliphilus]
MTRAHRILPLLLAILLWASPAPAGPPKAGDTLPPFTMPPLAVEEDAAELGLTANAPFTLADLPTPYTLMEIIGVYCPVCHEMSPQLTRLAKRLKRAGLDSRITLIGIAAGGTSMEVRYIRQREYAFPIAHDTGYEIHKLLGEPKTPFTMIVDRSGKVRYAHLGMIDDMDELFRRIQALEE